MSPLEDDDNDVDIGGPPDAPTNVEISGFEATTVTLKWKAPAKDGGAPIKEYLVSNSTLIKCHHKFKDICIFAIMKTDFFFEFD